MESASDALHQTSVLLMNAIFPRGGPSYLRSRRCVGPLMKRRHQKTHTQTKACTSPGFGVRRFDRPCYRARAYGHRHAGRNRGSWTMKKFVFAVVIAAIAASPAAAATKKKKAVRAPAPVASTNSNENSWRFAKDSLPI